MKRGGSTLKKDRLDFGNNDTSVRIWWWPSDYSHVSWTICWLSGNFHPHKTNLPSSTVS